MIQLRASDSFLKVVSAMKRVSALVLCEGSRDAEALKAVAGRLGLAEVLGNVAVTDAEGIATLMRNVLPAALRLIVGKVASRPVAAVVDADDAEPGERVRSLYDSLAAHGYRVSEPRHRCPSVWEARVVRGGDELPLLVAVNGVYEGPFDRFGIHELEDHVAYLKLLEGRLTEEDVSRASRSSDLVVKDDYEALGGAAPERVRRAFSHFECLLRALAEGATR